MQRPLRGIIPPLVTPLTPDGQLDIDALARVIEHVLAGGVHAVFILGTTGEATSLPYDTRRQLIQHTTKIVNRRVPVVVGVTDTVLAHGLSLARSAADHGADAVVVSTPYYATPNQSELTTYVNAFITGQPLPIVLYNIPHLTKMAFAPDTVKELAQNPRVMGMKDSSGDQPYFEAIRQLTDRPDFAFLVGNEPLIFAAYLRGAHGSIPSGANVAPRLFVKLHDALCEGRPSQPKARILFQQVSTLRQLYTQRPGAPGVIRYIKGALACLNICGPQVTPPFEPCTPAELEQIRRQLPELNLT
jgi:4-hydroxy-tetrahydrodipicolinate synthase